jgi:pimeloyl-ACP methyl ester carboxylesterase
VVTTVSDALPAVPGGRVFVRRWSGGPAKLAPVILLHDSLGSVEQWRDFPAALSQATLRDVLAYDRLGFGKSTVRTERPSLEFIAEEATQAFPALKRALGLGRFVLFGHSVGGAMALGIAASLPDACEAVITESAQAFVEARTLSGIQAGHTQFQDPAQFQKLLRWHGDRARWVLDAWTGVWLSPGFRAWSLDEVLPRVRCPVLAIHGDADEFGSLEFPRRIAGRAGAGAELAILSPCGHVPHRERREDVLRLSARFLASRAA